MSALPSSSRSLLLGVFQHLQCQSSVTLRETLAITRPLQTALLIQIEVYPFQNMCMRVMDEKCSVERKHRL